MMAAFLFAGLSLPYQADDRPPPIATLFSLGEFPFRQSMKWTKLHYLGDERLVYLDNNGRARIVVSGDGREIQLSNVTGERVAWFGVDGLGNSIACAQRILKLVPRNDFLIKKTHTITIYSFPDGRLLFKSPFRIDAQSQVLAYSPRGGYVAFSERTSAGNAVKVWSTRKDELVLEIKDLVDPVSSIAFSVDDSWLAFGDAVGRVDVWNISDRTKMRRLSGLEREITALAFSNNGMVVASSEEKMTKVWNAKNGEIIKEIKGVSCFSLAFSPDGSVLACGTISESVRLYETKNWRSLGSLGKEWGVTSVSVSPNGKHIAFSGITPHVWNLEKLAEGFTKKFGHKHAVQAIAASTIAGDRRIMTGSADGTLIIWDLNNKIPPRQIAANKEGVLAAAISPDAKVLASGGHDGMVMIWDLEPLKLSRCFAAHEASVTSLAFGRNGSLFASSGADGHLCVWDAKTWKCVAKIKDESRLPILSIAFSPVTNKLVFATRKQIRIFDLRADDHVLTLEQESFGIRTLAFSADGRTIVSCGSAGVSLYEVTSAKKIKGIEDFNVFGASSASFVDRNRLLVVSTPEKRMVVWDIPNWRKAGETNPLLGNIRATIRVIDDEHVAGACDDTTALVWRIPRFVDGVGKMEFDSEKTWNNLSSENADVGATAVWAIALNPAESVPYLHGKMHAVRLRSEDLEPLITKLESTDFRTRELAFKDLIDRGEGAKKLLMARWIATASAEGKQRIRAILDRLSRPNAEQLRAIRAIQALENVGSREALGVLEKMANGSQESIVTVEARKALSRSRPRVESKK